MEQIKEVRDLILSESDSWSAAPVFYSGRNLVPPTADHFYVGVFTSSFGGVTLVQIDELSASGTQGVGISTFSSAKSNVTFDFVGYRIFCPGRIK